MRIALFSKVYAPKIDGVVTRLHHTIQHLQQQGDEVMVVCPHYGSPSASLACLPNHLQYVPSIPLFCYPQLRLGCITATTWRKLNAFQPDVIHTLMPFTLGLGAAMYGRIRNIPLVASYHTDLLKCVKYYTIFTEKIAKLFVKNMHNMAQCNLVTSRAMMHQLKRLGVRQLQQWPAAVDTKLFHPRRYSSAMRQRLCRNPNKFVLLYVGRLAKEKHLEDLITTLQHDARLHLAVVGTGPYAATLRDRLPRNRTNFIGALHGQHLCAAYASADLFVFPSPSETLGLVVMEAMASGLPVVAVAAGGVVELVDHNHTGLLVSHHHAAAQLCNAVVQLANHRSLRQRLRQTALQQVGQYSWQHATQVLRQHYRHTTAKFLQQNSRRYGV